MGRVSRFYEVGQRSRWKEYLGEAVDFGSRSESTFGELWMRGGLEEGAPRLLGGGARSVDYCRGGSLPKPRLAQPRRCGGRDTGFGCRDRSDGEREPDPRGRSGAAWIPRAASCCDRI